MKNWKYHVQTIAVLLCMAALVVGFGAFPMVGVFVLISLLGAIGLFLLYSTIYELLGGTWE